MRTNNTILDLYAIIVIIILLTSCILQKRRNKQINIYLIGWMIAHMLMLCCDVVRWSLRGKMDGVLLFTVMFICEYVMAYICMGFFHYYFIDYMKENVEINTKLCLIVWPIIIVMSVLWAFSCKNRLFYVITYNAVNVPSDGYYLSQCPAMLLIMFDMFLVFHYRSRLGWRMVVTMWLYMVFPLLAFPMQYAWDAEVLFIGMLLSLLTRYVCISSEQNRLLAESRIAITMSQIQPHFLYNALGSISALCDIDPIHARDATDHFADYLRMNLESMKHISPISFQTELNHIKTYIWLEKMRFGEKLQVEFDIRTEKFQIPALSVQPIVENAVKHGICIKEDGGIVKILTRESKKEYIIEVSDNGIGFELSEISEHQDGKLHVGIKNVTERLEVMVRGSLTIQSEKGLGTIVIIRIPKHSYMTTLKNRQIP